jgi:hypothetical protein
MWLVLSIVWIGATGLLGLQMRAENDRIWQVREAQAKAAKAPTLPPLPPGFVLDAPPPVPPRAAYTSTPVDYNPFAPPTHTMRWLVIMFAPPAGLFVFGATIAWILSGFWRTRAAP